MNDWSKISLLLCVFGFLKEFRPSESFIFEYFTGPWRNLTDAQVTQEVYPIAIYSYLVQLFIVFLITDICRYKPLIVINGLSGIAVWGLFAWTRTLPYLQTAQVLFGLFQASEVAYYTYIYAKVDKEVYPLVTSHTRASILAGRALSGTLAQVLISFEIISYRGLNFITFGAVILATFWSLLLPSVGHSLYFHPRPKTEDKESTTNEKIINAFKLMKTQFLESYSQYSVIKWSLWYALATCGFVQVQYYIQPLWTVIKTDPNQSIYNGAVEAALAVVGFFMALAAGFLKIKKNYQQDLFICLGSLIQGAIIVVAATTTSLYVNYVSYILFGGLFNLMITYVSAEIAKDIKEDSFGLIFGFNTFIAMIVQTLLTSVLATDVFNIMLDIRQQYYCYSAYHFLFAVIFLIRRKTVNYEVNKSEKHIVKFNKQLFD